MFGLFKSSPNSLPEQWQTLDNEEKLKKIDEASHKRPQVIFKHSTRCSISSTAFHRMNKGIAELAEKSDVHYLDLIAYRDVSNSVAEHYGVQHESPQVLIVKNGQSIRHMSHNAIRPEAILAD